MDYIFYHNNCNDGACAAALMKFAKPNARLIPISYGKEPEIVNEFLGFDSISGSNVYFVDFCINSDLLNLIANKNVSSITIIDHHLSALNLCSRFAESYAATVDKSFIFNFIYDEKESGASLTFKYLIDNDFGISVPPSYFYTIVNMIKDRDLWKFKLPDSNYFAEYLFNCESAFSELLNLFEDGSNLRVEECVSAGEALLEAKNLYVRKRLETYFPVKHKEIVNDVEVEFVVINETRLDAVSQIGNEIVNKYDCIAFLYNIEQTETEITVNVSLRGADHLPSCADIAIANGGGGHRNSARYKVSGSSFVLKTLFS